MTKKKSRYCTIESYNPDPSVRYEQNSGERVTIEGESYTISELMARHNRMHYPETERPGFYEDTEDFDGIDFQKLPGMDIHDRMELYAQTEQRAAKAREKLEAALKAKEDEAPDNANERSGESKGGGNKPPSNESPTPPAPDEP